MHFRDTTSRPCDSSGEVFSAANHIQRDEPSAATISVVTASVPPIRGPVSERGESPDDGNLEDQQETDEQPGPRARHRCSGDPNSHARGTISKSNVTYASTKT